MYILGSGLIILMTTLDILKPKGN